MTRFQLSNTLSHTTEIQVCKGQHHLVQSSVTLLLLPVSHGFCLTLQPQPVNTHPLYEILCILFPLPGISPGIYSTWLHPPFHVGLISSNRPDMITLTKVGILFYSCILQHGTPFNVLFWNFYLLWRISSTRMWAPWGKTNYHLAPLLLFQFIKQSLEYGKSSRSMLDESWKC